MAGCSSGSNSSGTSSAAASSVASSPATSAKATTAAGGGATSLDAQSVTWFETMCQGLEPLTSFEGKLGQNSTAGEISSSLAELGTAMTDTAKELSELPPPTVEGGDELAQRVVAGLDDFGTTFSDFSTRAVSLKEGDTAAAQQFVTDLQNAVAASPIADAQPSAEVQAEVRKIPACQGTFGS